MNPRVVDASVVAAAFFQEKHAQPARSLLVSDAPLHAPDLIYAELGNVIWKRRARGEIDQVSGIVSSVMFLQSGMALAILLLTGLLAYLLPVFWGQRLGRGIGDAQIVLLTLGASLAIQIALAAFTGVITGCHRWDIHNYIKAGWHAATVVAMIVVLQLGLGIRSLAVASLVGLGLADLNRVLYAFILCPGMRVGPRFVRVCMIRDAFRFGVKTLGPRVGDLLLNQTSSILIASFLGPAALALYSRPRSLAQQTHMLVSKLAMVVIPTASAMHSANQREELRELLVNATRYAACISLPLTAGLVIMGRPLMLLWMGPDYANGTLVAIVALGNLAMFTLMPAMSLLTGLNAHGRPGMVHLAAAVCSVGLVFLVLGPLKLGLEGVAVAVGLPLTVAYGWYVLAHTCHHVRIRWTTFLYRAFGTPVLCVLPMAACLVAFRVVMPAQPLHPLWLGSVTGGILLAVAYWRYILPDRIKARTLRMFGMRGTAA